MILQTSKKYLYQIFFIIIFCTAAFIKLYKIDYFATYQFEIGQHLLQLSQLQDGKLLIEGPFSTHDWFRFSATPYYLFFPIFSLFKFHPLALALTWTAVSIFSVWLMYYVVKRLFDIRTGLIAALLYTISGNVLLMDHNMSFFAFVLPLSLLLFLESKKVYFEKTGMLWMTFLFISTMATLHPSAYMFLPLYITFSFFIRPNKKEIVRSCAAFVIPQLPLLLLDVTRNFKTTLSFMLWVPYKLVQFLSGKTIGFQKAEVEDNSLQYVVDFIKLSIFPQYLPWWLGFGLLAVLSIFLVISLKKKMWRIETMLATILLYGLVALLIHKNSPPHYFVPILLLPIILTARFITMLIDSRYKLLTLCGLLSIVVLNIHWIQSHYLTAEIAQPYAEQEAISKVIIDDAQGAEYALRRVGQFDYYPQQASENYRYILRWLGNAPVADAQTEYVIVEDETKKLTDSELQLVSAVANVRIYKVAK